MNEWTNQIVVRAEEIREQLAHHPTIGNFVDSSLSIPKPFQGTGEIKLIVIGQDPTVQRKESRARITTVLNLNSRGSLTRYLDTICTQLGFKWRENLYATNACKNFFVDPPTTLQKNHNVNVLQESAPYWLPLLRDEIAEFPQALIISLGEPVLSQLVQVGGSHLMKHYWGYSRNWRQGYMATLSPITRKFSTLDRIIFPFPHQPSLRKQFYRDRLPQYLEFVRKALL